MIFLNFLYSADVENELENIVFEGGGAKAVGYIGAFEVLEERGVTQRVSRYGGASAGAMVGMLGSLNFSADEMREFFWNEFKFSEVLDGSRLVVPNIWRFLRSYGWYKGEYLDNKLASMIERKTGRSDTTFEQMHALKVREPFKDLYVPAMNFNTRFPEIFSHEHTPNVKIADAVKASMSIPLVFPPQKIGESLYVDGSFTHKYPIEMFDYAEYRPAYQTEVDFLRHGNMATLGLRIDSQKEIDVFARNRNPAPVPITGCCGGSILGYLKRFMEVSLSGCETQHLFDLRRSRNRTIYIDTLDADFLDFNMSDESKTRLIQSGRDCSLAYFAGLGEGLVRDNI